MKLSANCGEALRTENVVLAGSDPRLITVGRGEGCGVCDGAELG